jgi:hypothetical protein
MRFMMLMIPGGYASAAPDAMPSPEAIDAMMKYNEELKRAGALLALEGLHPPASGARITYKGGKATVTDGPFPEVKEVLGGYWLIDVRSREEALEWAHRIPAAEDDIVEVRQVHDMSEFSEEVQEAAARLDISAG